MSWPRAAFDEQHKAIFQMLDGVGTRPGLLRIYPHRRLCDAAKCSIFVSGNALYRDQSHVSVAGANFLLPDFEPLFAGTTAFTSSVRP
jgi:hypothetical protein